MKRVKNYEPIIAKWVCDTLKDSEAFWEIPVSKADNELGFNISIAYLQSVIGCSRSVVIKYRHLATPLIEKMLEQQILVTISDGIYVSAIEYRRRLLNWYRKLSVAEKKKLPIFGNKILFSKLPNTINPLTKKALGFELIKETLDVIYSDLISIDVINPDYQTVAERNREKQKNPKPRYENREKRFERLAYPKLKHVKDFFKPTKLEPFIQVEQIFACKIETLRAKSTINNYSNACANFIRFLRQFYGNKPLLIVETFDKHILSRFRKYLEQQVISNNISSYYATTVLSATRKTLNRLLMVDGFSYRFFDIEGFQGQRQTDLKKPFTKDERQQISTAIEKALAKSRKFLVPYQATGIGKNPLDSNGNIKRGFNTIENARWLFENRLACHPVYYHTAETHYEKKFLSIINNSGHSLHKVYSNWGVNPISADIILPYVLKIALTTGLNLDSILNLEVDDYVDCHPLTLKPCLRYFKERSNGNKEYHLDLFKAQLNWLTSSQAQIVKSIFEEMLQLTKDIRKHVKEEVTKSKLFICQTARGRKNQGMVIPIAQKNSKYSPILTRTISKFIEKYNLKDKSGDRITLTIGRFRPTLVSELVENGVSLREIQVLLGHASISTTIGYLDSLDFSLMNRIKLNTELNKIHNSTLREHVEQSPQPIQENQNDKKIIFRTPVSECRNIFNPPDFIKNLSSYVPGTPCAQYNKCLSCDNVIITLKELPRLFAMQRDYQHLIEHTQVVNTPYSRVISENMDLIKSIIDPKISDFSKQELEDAQRLSEYVETTSLIDGVVL